MSTPWRCKHSLEGRGVERCAPPTRRRPGIAASCAVTACCLLLAGCTYSGGELLYFLGFGKPRMIEAVFRLSPGPVLVFVDDVNERMESPKAGRNLFEALSQELLRHEAAERIIPLRTVEQLRQTMPDFDKRGCREIGELAGAEQVLWIEVRDFLAEEQIFDASNAAYIVVTVKVINVLESQRRSRVRLWPTSPDGFLVTAKMNGSEVVTIGNKDAIGQELTTRLAGHIAMLFYDHRASEFERKE
ncbi:MAG: hypothetical protein IIC01_00415 [Planctomycetes bacterium]|nr:hypothetical protein [Planctomycetota bacterium]